MGFFRSDGRLNIDVYNGNQCKMLLLTLKKFHSTHYCPDRMYGVIIANKTLDDLEVLAHKNFDDIKL